MKIINQTQNTIIATDASIADSAFKRMKGLLGRKDLKNGGALIIKPCNSIHTFFMRFAIDVLFVDKDNKVIKAISLFKPFRVTSLYWSSTLVIELPTETIQSSTTKAGDLLLFED